MRYKLNQDNCYNNITVEQNKWKEYMTSTVKINKTRIMSYFIGCIILLWSINYVFFHLAYQFDVINLAYLTSVGIALLYGCVMMVRHGVIFSKPTEKIQDKSDKKTPNSIENETSQEEIIDLKKGIQDAAVMLGTYSQELEKAKTELDVVTLEVKTVREEVESARNEIQSIRAERDSILKQIKVSKEELELTKSQYTQNEIEQIKRQINEVQDELSKINSEKESVALELEEMRSKAFSTKEEYKKILSSKEMEEKAIAALKDQHEMKKKEIVLSKKELEFIETELATVGRGDNTKKIVEAAGAVAAAINVKYEATKKELEIVKIALARTKEEYEVAKKEIETLRNKISEKNITSEI